MKFLMQCIASAFLLAFLLMACSTTKPVSEVRTLNSTAWLLTDLPGQALFPDAPATLRFEDGRAQGSDGCNRYSTKYSATGRNLTISAQGTTTRMACPPPRMKLAQAFMTAIQQTRAYRIDDGKLLMLDATGAILATFTQQRQELAGSTWRVTGYNNGKQAVVSVLRDSELTLTFSADGKLNGSAGCNRLTGAYTTSNQELTISSVATTRRLCAQPEGVMEQEIRFLKALETVASARFEGNRLELRTAEGALAVTLIAENSAEAP